MKTNEIIEKIVKGTMGKIPRKVTVFKCTQCSELAEDKEDLIKEVEQWQCVDCGEIHEDRDDAYNCCV